MLKFLEKQEKPNQDLNVAILNEENDNDNEKNKKNNKNNKNEKPKSSSELESDKEENTENTDDTENIPDPNIKKVKISDSLKHSTSTSKKDIPLKHRIQIKRKT